MIHRKVSAILPAMVLTLTSVAIAADPDINILKNSGSLDRLFKKTGVYNASSTGKTPGFVVDPSWPQPLPNNWLLGQIGGLYVDQHDHIWVYNRPRTMTTDEAGLEGPVPGATDDKGQPINGIGQVRAWGPSQIAAKPLLRFWSSIPTASCCVPGAVRPIPVSSAVNVRPRQAASGQAVSTVFMSTTTTTSGSREIPRRPQWPRGCGPRSTALDDEQGRRRRLCTEV